MPAEIERKLKKRAKKLHLGKGRENAYVYGTLNKIEKGKKRSKSKVNRGSRYNIGEDE